MPSSTQWRLNIKGNNGGGVEDNLQITDIAMHTSIGGANVCVGGVASADSFYGVGFEADKAFDQNATTRWLPTGNSGAQPHWIQYTFASPVSIVEYTINACSASNQPTSAPRFWWLEYFDGIRWWPVDFQHDQGSWGATETRVFTVNSSSPPLNNCVEGTALASSESFGYAAANAFQGTITSLQTLNLQPWIAQTATGWLEYNFLDLGGALPAINSYSIQALYEAGGTSITYSPISWTFEYFDGVNWIAVDSRTGVPPWTQGERRTYTFTNAISAAKWRINISANQGGANVGILNLFMFGPLVSPPIVPAGKAPIKVCSGQTFLGLYFVNHNGKAYIQDPIGNLYLLSRDVYKDANTAINVNGRTPLIDGGDNYRKFWNQVTVIGDRTPGSSLLYLTFTDDDYNTFSPQYPVDMSLEKPAAYSQGQSRRRAYQWTYTDNFPLRLVGLEVEVTKGS